MTRDRTTYLKNHLALLGGNLSLLEGNVTVIDGDLVTIDGNLLLKNGYAFSSVMWKDELQSLIAQEKNNPSDRIVTNYAEGSLDFGALATTANYAVMNIQINHDWLKGTEIRPHLHWFKNAANNPNWVMEYRWQVNGQSKVDDWTSLALDHHLFSYTAGTICQISKADAIVPPEAATLSEILQIRVLRDSANASGLFGGADPYVGAASAVNFDVHYAVDANGSRQEYSK